MAGRSLKRAGFVSCLPPGVHPGMDAIAHGLALALSSGGVELDVFPADLRGSHGAAGAIGEKQTRAVNAAVAAGMDALVVFVLDAREPAAAVDAALNRGIPVIAIHRPAYPVSAAIIVPNYHQGVVLGQALFRAVGSPPIGTKKVAIVGGPEIVDDVELVRGAVDGVRGAGLTLVNDPFAPIYRNLDDVRGAGRKAVERVIADCFPFDGCVIFNDETLLDALEVFAACGLTGKVPLVSRNGAPVVIAEILRGRTHATFDYQLPEIGVLAGRTVLKLWASNPMGVSGRSKLRADTLVSAPFGELYTAENAPRYIPWSQRAPLVTLRVHS